MKKIERPDWDKLVWYMEQHQKIVSNLNVWFDDHIEPLNKALDEAVEVYTDEHFANESGRWWEYRAGVKPCKTDTHKALLINIQPIKHETCADVLRDIIEQDPIAKFEEDLLMPLIKRAKAALARESDE